jgi:hypothetical protein
MKRAVCWLSVFVPLAAWSLEAAAQDPSDEIYREDRVATFRLTMSAASWNAICNDGGGVGDTWQRADMTWQSEPVVVGVGVKRSGVGTRNLDTPKPAIRLSFNEFEFANPAGPGTPGRKWRGVNRIKLDSMIGNTDQAMMRDRVAYKIFRDVGAPAPRACHARLYVNGSFKGLYTVEEPVRKDFLRYTLNEDGGNLYKSEGYDEFRWRGTSASSYIPDPWIAETNYPGGNYGDLVELINIVNNYPTGEIRTRLNNHINLDGFLRHLAVEAVYGDSDGFNNWGSGGSNNHYWYHRASSNRMEVIKWDPGASQGMYEVSNGFAKGESPLGYAYSRSAITRWIPNDATAWPTLKTKIRAILDGPMTGIQGRIDSIYDQIKSHAYEDPLKGAHANDPAGFTDAEFDAAVTWLKDWYVKRIAYLRTQVGGTTTTPPAAPSGLTATATSSSQINLSWTDASSSETGFEIDRAAASSGPWTQIATVGANVTIYSNTGLTASTTYYYRVRATNSAGDSANSNVASATTQAPPATVPAAPSGLTATATSSSQINLSWTDASSSETGFEIDRAAASSGPWTQIATVGANVTIYSNTGLTASTTYYYRVRATNAAGDSANSNVASATTPSPGTPVTGTGLSGTYYDNEDFTGASVTRTDATVDFNWGSLAPAPGIGPDTFSIRWTGRVRAQYSETYTFTTFTNDGVRLWVEGELLVDKWVQQSGGIEWSAQVALQAGRWYTVQMDYYEGVGNSVARLSWSSPSTPEQVIPQSMLDPALGSPDSRDNDGDGIPNDADLDDDNDGIPDLQDPDRDGDGLTNLAEIATGSDPNDRTSPNAGGGPPAVPDGDNPNGDGSINDRCAVGSIGAPRVPVWVLWLIVGLTFMGLRKREGL